MTQVRESTIGIMWDPPKETNGVIIVYEVIYSMNISDFMDVMAVNTTELQITLTTLQVYNIRVRAYTRAGPGPVHLVDYMFVPLATTDSLTVNFSIIAVTDSLASTNSSDNGPLIGGVASFIVVVILVAVAVIIVYYFRRYV